MTRARNIANRALSDITSPNANQNITITPNGGGDVIAETDTLTLNNTSDGGTGPSFVLNHVTASPATTDTSAIKYTTTDSGGNPITAGQITFRSPDLTSGAAAGRIDMRVKETDSGIAQTYFRIEGNSEQVTFFKPIVNSSLIEANGGLEVNGKLDIEEVAEKVFVYGQGGGAFSYDTTAQAVAYDTTAQFQNRTLSFTNVNSSMTDGQSKTLTWILTTGTTAYYPTTIFIDGSNVSSSIKWQGGSAPTSGNASSLDIYTFTIIKTANATFTVLASQTQFA